MIKNTDIYAPGNYIEHALVVVQAEPFLSHNLSLGEF